MDFKALSRTAEADVRAFASVALQRLVRTRFFPVEQTRNLRQQGRVPNPTSTAEATKTNRVQRLEVRRICSPRSTRNAMKPRERVIPWLSMEEASSLPPGRGASERLEESWIESIPSVKRALTKTTPRTALPSRQSDEVKPRPQFHSGTRLPAVPSDGPRQPQLQTHAIHRAASIHA